MHYKTSTDTITVYAGENSVLTNNQISGFWSVFDVKVYGDDVIIFSDNIDMIVTNLGYEVAKQNDTITRVYIDYIRNKFEYLVINSGGFP